MKESGVTRAHPGEQEPLSVGFPGLLPHPDPLVVGWGPSQRQTCWRWVGVPPQRSPPPSASAPQGWTSLPTKTRRVTRRPTSWRSTRTPRNAPSGPTLGSTGPSPPMGASSPPPPQSEFPIPSGSGPCLGFGDLSASPRGIRGGFSSLGACPQTLPSEGSEFPGEPGPG